MIGVVIVAVPIYEGLKELHNHPGRLVLAGSHGAEHGGATGGGWRKEVEWEVGWGGRGGGGAKRGGGGGGEEWRSKWWLERRKVLPQQGKI